LTCFFLYSIFFILIYSLIPSTPKKKHDKKNNFFFRVKEPVKKMDLKGGLYDEAPPPRQLLMSLNELKRLAFNGVPENFLDFTTDELNPPTEQPPTPPTPTKPIVLRAANPPAASKTRQWCPRPKRCLKFVVGDRVDYCCPPKKKQQRRKSHK